MSGGVGAAHGREHDGRATGVRVLIEYGRKILLYSLILSRQVVILKTSLSRKRGDRSIGGCFLPIRYAAESERKRGGLVGEKPGAQPPLRDYNTVLNIVNSILLC
jgi:hypothetical protein